jgi:hypothetical protein
MIAKLMLSLLTAAIAIISVSASFSAKLNHTGDSDNFNALSKLFRTLTASLCLDAISFFANGMYLFWLLNLSICIF